jgi:tetratricopeptide (TPR) repeat protein
VAAYDAALRAFPQDENVWVRRGQALDGLQRYAEAETCFLTAIELDPNLAALYWYYAAHLRRVGREADVDVQLTKAIQLHAANLSRLLSDPSDVHRLPPPDANDQ